MRTVIANMSMSPDSWIADPDDGVGSLFDRYSAGHVEVRTADHHTSHTDPAVGLAAPTARVLLEDPTVTGERGVTHLDDVVPRTANEHDDQVRA
jgi:hypothetical protein